MSATETLHVGPLLGPRRTTLSNTPGIHSGTTKGGLPSQQPSTKMIVMAGSTSREQATKQSSETERMIKISSYLSRDLSAKGPDLRRLRGETIRNMKLTISGLFHNLGSNPRHLALIYQPLREYPQFLEVCQLVYSTKQRDEIQTVYEEQPKLDRYQLTMAMLGAAVHDWLFNKNRGSLTKALKGRDRRASMFEEEIFKRMYTLHLHPKVPKLD